MANAPTFHADLGSGPAGKNARLLKVFAVVLAVLAGGMLVSVVHWGPAKTVDKVRAVVEALKPSAVPPAAAPAAAEDEAAPSPRHRQKRAASGPVRMSAPAFSGFSSNPSVSIPDPPGIATAGGYGIGARAGMDRAKLLELYGKPDLRILALEHGALIERYIWVNRALGSVTDAVLKDGRVVGVLMDPPHPGRKLSASAARPVKKTRHTRAFLR